jgi:hypothetical protein
LLLSGLVAAPSGDSLFPCLPCLGTFEPNGFLLASIYLTAILFGLSALPPHGDLLLALRPRPLTAKLIFNSPHNECSFFFPAPSQQNRISIHLTVNANFYFSSASLGQYFICTSQWYALLNHGDRCL